jgi:hypothetical protein
MEKFYVSGEGWKLPLSCASSIVAAACMDTSVLWSDRGSGGWNWLDARNWVRGELSDYPGFIFLPGVLLRWVLKGLV